MSAPIELIGVGVPLAVVAASLAGSSHCALMCGPLVAVVGRDARSATLYHLGRAAGYAAAGALAGILGRNVFDPRMGTVAGWLSSLALGLALIGLGIKIWQGGAFQFRMPRFLESTFQSSLASAHRRGGIFSGGCGLLSVFLPCGWLHSFVIAAAATQNPWKGAFLMLSFWAGTLPALTLGAVALKKSIGILSERVPKASAVLLILAGSATIGLRYYRWQSTSDSSVTPHCHLSH